MLTVILKSGTVFNRYHSMHLPALTSGEIQEMRADGDELDDIRHVFEHLTPTNVNIAIWTQPFAELIYANLRLSRFYAGK